MRGRLGHLMAAGVVDSLCLSLGWTVLVLHVLSRHGLAAAGVLTAASLVGVALSAPVASAAARRCDGKNLLRWTAGTEAALRLSVFGLMLAGAPLWMLAVNAALLNVTAWTGYAAMRAEVTSIASGPAALTWYCTLVAAVEAIGVALAAALPSHAEPHVGGVHLAVAAVYVLGLAPTVVVAGGSTVGRSLERASHPRRRPRSWLRGPAPSSALFMLAGAGPTLLSVVLAEHLHGRWAVAVAACAFTVGSLAAPPLTQRLQAWSIDRAVVWAGCALGMLVGWLAAPVSVGFLCLAQLLSGLFMTTLEGLSDTAAAQRQPRQVTSALAHVTAARAVGSAGATAGLPLLLAQAGLPASVGVLALSAVAVAPLLIGLYAIRGPGDRPRHRVAAGADSARVVGEANSQVDAAPVPAR